MSTLIFDYLNLLYLNNQYIKKYLSSNNLRESKLSFFLANGSKHFYKNVHGKYYHFLPTKPREQNKFYFNQNVQTLTYGIQIQYPTVSGEDTRTPFPGREKEGERAGREEGE